ncbi:sugar ABC transporter substrate-binding protein [Ktedonosporobacter rubrisoli]|uniref:Sugar ABC transporter substrate-binding protein n=1 Tax=Ktedonosporobacter rubrisoli TaxID=2509675 RepID=A0A4P6JKC2_KTERU|nr:sugar ABC transporter substrate-binding protein [Ktedonosporobacter rubrisoli]QBD75608.1 sugar ABC transporter substrate-binding protein [Ktedonosporobacter rubrisoli]
MQLAHRRRGLANVAQRNGGTRSAFDPRRPGGWMAFGLIFSLMLVVFTSCGSPDNTASQGGKVNLTYALWDQNQQPAYQKSIDEFEKQHPNIKVTIQQTPWAQYWQKLNTEFAGNSAPDVFWDHVAYFPQFAQQGVLMDLSPLIEKDKLDLSVYYPQLIKQFQYQDKYYGMPKDWDTITLIYNKNIFKQMNVQEPDDKLNWNPTDGGSFLKLLQKLTVDKSGKHADEPDFDAKNIKQYGFVSLNSNQSAYLNYIAMNGGKFLDKPFGQKFVFNQPESVQALQFLVDLIAKWHVSPPASQTNDVSNVDIQMLARGQAAMIETGSWNVSYIAQQTNFPIGIAQLPSGPKGRVSVFNGLSDAISAKTAHAQEAWELVKWLASPHSQELIGGQGIVWPAVKNADQNFADFWKKKDIDVTPFFTEAQGATVSFPITPGFNEAQTKINDIFNQMYLGQIPVQKATDTAVQQGNAAISGATSEGS